MKETITRRDFLIKSVAAGLAPFALAHASLSSETSYSRNRQPTPVPSPTEQPPSLFARNKREEDLRIREKNATLRESTEKLFGIQLLSSAQLYEQFKVSVPDVIRLTSAEWDEGRLILLREFLSLYPPSYYQTPYVNEQMKLILGGTKEVTVGKFTDLKDSNCCTQSAREQQVADAIQFSTSSFDPRKKIESFLITTHEFGHQATPVINESFPPIAQAQSATIAARQSEWMVSASAALGVRNRQEADILLKNQQPAPAPFFYSPEQGRLNDYLRNGLKGGLAEHVAVNAELYVQGWERFRTIVADQYRLGNEKAKLLYEFTREITFRGDAEYARFPLVG